MSDYSDLLVDLTALTTLTVLEWSYMPEWSDYLVDLITLDCLIV